MSIKAVLVVLLASLSASAQSVTSFEGIDASQVAHPKFDVDPNGAVGTKQYMEWTNVYYQAFDKHSLAPIWSSPQTGTQPFQSAGLSNCTNVGGDGIITFDRLARRWIMAMRSTVGSNNYYYCVAVSNTDDLSSPSLNWHTYQFSLNPFLTNSKGKVFWPDWPRWGTWGNAYYVSFDLNDASNGYEQVGVVVCALDRTNMLTGATLNPMQCFSDPSPIPKNDALYLKHSVIPADIEGPNAPPSGRDEYMISIQNPVHDQHTTTSNTVNLWQFHVDWNNPGNSFLVSAPLNVDTYTQGCYNPRDVSSANCVPELSSKNTQNKIDSVGDRLMPRFAYRNFGSYESFLVSHTVLVGTTNKQTGIRWYELRGDGVNAPSLYQSDTVNLNSLFRFMPSIAQDKVGNAAVGYNTSNGANHPGIRAAWWNLTNSTQPKELIITKGTGDEENSPRYGDYNSMTVDPVDDCTFWFVSEYFQTDQTGNQIDWSTRIAHFKVSTCK